MLILHPVHTVPPSSAPAPVEDTMLWDDGTPMLWDDNEATKWDDQ